MRKKSPPAKAELFQTILTRRLGRRDVLRGAVALAPLLVVRCSPNTTPPPVNPPVKLAFEPIALGTDDALRVPPGYESQVLIRWGDPLFPDVPAFDIMAQTPELQAKRFGQNNDFTAYFPLPGPDSKSDLHGLLAVNHEFTEGQTMFPGYVSGSPTLEQVQIEMAAHGLSVLEIIRDVRWRYVVGSPFSRRITGDTEIALSGPLVGHEWMKTSYDPNGERVRGTLNNCAGGVTPWGTYLMAEENFNQYFGQMNGMSDADPRKAVHKTYGLSGGASRRAWEKHVSRFDVSVEPNEAFRFGFIVEVDPYDANSVPKKRTALGRKKNECAETAVAKDGRIAVYSGEDQLFHWFYKFISAKPMSTTDRAANRDLLDEGTLHVARFNDDGSGEWVPLVGGAGPLASWTQADVLLNTRGAAAAAGGTRMDKPEDVARNPVNGKLYFVMTGSSPTRGTEFPVDAANPRPTNNHGHIIEIVEENDDAGSTKFQWEMFMLCGDPANAADGAYFAGFDPSQVSPISCPDNLTFDHSGNLWIATDGQGGTLSKNDGLHAVPTSGDARGHSRFFLSAPVQAEPTGPTFSPGDTTLFCSISHPGRAGTVEAPTSQWPDGGLPRPAVVAITRKGEPNGKIGT